MDIFLNSLSQIVTLIVNNWKNIEPILICGSFALSIIKYVSNYYYAIQCERFYNIPRHYFSNNIINNILDGSLICVLGALNYFSFLTVNNGFVIFIIIFLSLVILFTIFIFNDSKYSIIIRDNKNVQKYLLVLIVFSVAIVLLENSCAIVYKLFLVIYILIFIIALFRNFIVRIKYKNEYEVVVVVDESGETEYIVLSHCNNKLICVSFDFYESSDNNILDLKTKPYYIFDTHESKIFLKDFAKNKKFVLKVNGI